MFGAGRLLAGAVLLAIGLVRFGEGLYIPAKAWLAQVLIGRAWAATQPGIAHRPWPWADTQPVARLVAPAAGVDLVVLAGGSGRTLAFGPGHVTGSAGAGEPGNVVIAGHRDTHFAFLAGLKVGSEIVLERADRRRFRYLVDSTAVVDARTHRLANDPDAALLTLVTCFPFDAARAGGPMRYVVTATLVGAAVPPAPPRLARPAPAR